MIAPLLESQFKALLANLGKALKPVGFKKSGAKFSRWDEGILRVVQVQRDKWNDESNLKFCVNFGLGSMVLMNAQPFGLAKSPGEADCQIRGRLFAPQWWSLRPETTEEELQAAVNVIVSKLHSEAFYPYTSIIDEATLCEYWLNRDQLSFAEERGLLILLKSMEQRELMLLRAAAFWQSNAKTKEQRVFFESLGIWEALQN